MTDLRALDRLQPPDLWPEIVDRARRPESAEPPRRPRRLLAAAAAVVVLAGVAGGLAVVRLGGDDAGTDRPAAEDPTPPVRADDFWGHVWNLVELRHDGEAVAVPEGVEGDLVRTGSSAPFLDTTTRGSVGYGGCGQGGMAAHVAGGRIVANSSWGQDLPGCDEHLMDVDELMVELLTGGPAVALDDGRLTVRSDRTEALFSDAEADGPVLVWSGVGSCAAGLEDGPVLRPGPHRPAVIRLGDGIDPETRSGTWHTIIGEQRVELQVPLTPVIDYVGERTEPIELDSGWEGIVWYRFGVGVSVRAQRVGQPDACSTLDVTVTGGSEREARDLAVELANDLVIAEY